MKKLLLVTCLFMLAGGALAQDTPVSDIQHGIGLTPGANLVVPRGIITAITSDGFFVVDYYVADPGAWDGIFVYMGSVAFDLMVGDVIALCGVYEEFEGLTRINVEYAGLYGSSLKVGATTVPPPSVISAAELLDPAVAESWESCVITIQDGMEVTSLPDVDGIWSTLCQDGTPLLMGDFWVDPTSVSLGQCYDNTTGIWYEISGTYLHQPFVDGLEITSCTVPNEAVSFGTIKALYR